MAPDVDLRRVDSMSVLADRDVDMWSSGGTAEGVRNRFNGTEVILPFLNPSRSARILENCHHAPSD